MKYNDLTVKQKELLNAFIQGETLECIDADYGKWIEMPAFGFMHELIYGEVRIKPKEPMVTQTFSPVFKNGAPSYLNYGSIREIWQNIDDKLIHSFIIKTYRDGVFVGARIIPKSELELKGLV